MVGWICIYVIFRFMLANFEDSAMNEEQLEALKAMHIGLLNMQRRLDDHEKVIESLMLVMQDLTSGRVPKGFRQPPKVN